MIRNREMSRADNGSHALVQSSMAGVAFVAPLALLQLLALGVDRQATDTGCWHVGVSPAAQPKFDCNFKLCI